jgi:hypothetical protein
VLSRTINTVYVSRAESLVAPAVQSWLSNLVLYAQVNSAQNRGNNPETRARELALRVNEHILIQPTPNWFARTLALNSSHFAASQHMILDMHTHAGKQTFLATPAEIVVSSGHRPSHSFPLLSWNSVRPVPSRYVRQCLVSLDR